MNKASIVENVHGQMGGSKAEAERLVDGIFDSIVTALKSGEEVSVAGFGIFSIYPGQ